MRVGLDVPQPVLFARVLVARHLLLLEPPLGKLDLVTEEVAAGKDVSEAEPRPERLQPRPRLLAARHVRRKLVDLDLEVIVRVAFEAVEAVRRDLVLVVDFGERCADVVRVELLVRGDVVQNDDLLVEDWGRRGVVFGVGDVGIGGAVEEEPDVIVVAVRVKRDLLLCVGAGTRSALSRSGRERVRTLASGGVVVRVRMKVAALRVEVAKRNVRSDHDVCGRAQY